MTVIFNERTKIKGTVDVGGDSVQEGGTKKINVTDENQNSLLVNILKELKIMNIHLAIITDNVITEEI